VDNGVLVVEREDEPRFERPLELVAALHIHGPAKITSGAIAELIRTGAHIVVRSTSGYPIGCTQPMHVAGLLARRAQYAVAAGQ
jgi:CRISPR/Cas system-associated endonuclease Cas1